MSGLPKCLGGNDTVYGLRLGCVAAGREVFVVAKTMGEPCKSFYYRTPYFENLYRHTPNDVQLGQCCSWPLCIFGG